jgi:hypothetical protein
MADGGEVMNPMTEAQRLSSIATENNAPNTQQVAYDTRTDSQKALAYLMGEANATNPMLFTHKQATGPVEPADMLTRKGGKYILDSATNEYVWVPDAAAAPPAAGLPALVNAGGGGGPRDPADQDRINNLFDSYASQDKVFGLPPGTTASEARSKDLMAAGKFIMSPLSSLFSMAKDALIGPQPKSYAEVMAGLRPGLHDESEGDMNTDTSPPTTAPAAPAAPAGKPGETAVGGSGYGGFDNSAPGAGYGQTASGGIDGSFYSKGGITAFAGGGLGSLGGYSDGGQLLKGPGDGVSDSIPAKIAGNQPARLADGEFVIPARIVSELGNGSTDAGARELYKMMARIQAGRAKTVGKNKTAVNSKSARHLPA